MDIIRQEAGKTGFIPARCRNGSLRWQRVVGSNAEAAGLQCGLVNNTHTRADEPTYKRSLVAICTNNAVIGVGCRVDSPITHTPSKNSPSLYGLSELRGTIETWHIKWYNICLRSSSFLAGYNFISAIYEQKSKCSLFSAFPELVSCVRRSTALPPVSVQLGCPCPQNISSKSEERLAMGWTWLRAH